jgi:hypothetical protein
MFFSLEREKNLKARLFDCSRSQMMDKESLILIHRFLGTMILRHDFLSVELNTDSKYIAKVIKSTPSMIFCQEMKT